MEAFKIEVNEEERAFLARIVEDWLEETRVELRRTDTPDYQEQVKHEEEITRTLLHKLQASAHAG
jgi:hypothetical protein